MPLTRRRLITAGSATLALAGLSRLSLAAPRDSRLMLVILRGGLDGLAAVAPYGDDDYPRQRATLALDRTELLDLDGFFGLHPSLETLHGWYQNRQLAVFHATATPYRERSHFDAQNVLDTGGRAPGVRKGGWLNRALAALAPGDRAVALGRTVPLVLRGQQAVSAWAPSRLPDGDRDTLERVLRLYQRDAHLLRRLQDALRIEAVAAGYDRAERTRRDPAGTLLAAAGRILADPAGPAIAVLEVGGWDTHARQGGRGGQLAGRLRRLDQGLARLRAELNGTWARTAVLVVTEFGRTVAGNGANGTDHGTAGCAFLAGGAVASPGVVCDWPGLSPRALHDGRDLRATLDLRSVCKGILFDHLRISEAALEERVFPESRDAEPLTGLLA